MLNWIVRNRTDYLYKNDLVLNNLQRLICHKTQPTNQPLSGGTCGVMVIVIGNRLGYYQSSNPGWDCLHFT